MGAIDTTVMVAIAGLTLAGILVAAGIAKPLILRGVGFVNAETTAALSGAEQNGGLF